MSELDKKKVEVVLTEEEKPQNKYDKRRYWDVEIMLRENDDMSEIARRIIEGSKEKPGVLDKDIMDRFLDYVLFKVRTGDTHIHNLAYPAKKIPDPILEEKIIKLINVNLNPVIVPRLLKFFARNIYDSNTNLYLAYLINSDDIIKAVYETFLIFKKDIFETDNVKKIKNVRIVQQYSLEADEKISSPLDAACRFKYILEYIALNLEVGHIYKKKDISLSGIDS